MKSANTIRAAVRNFMRRGYHRNNGKVGAAKGRGKSEIGLVQSQIPTFLLRYSHRSRPLRVILPAAGNLFLQISWRWLNFSIRVYRTRNQRVLTRRWIRPIDRPQ